MIKGIFLGTSVLIFLVQFIPSENHVQLRHPDRCLDTAIGQTASRCYEWTGWSGCDVTCGTGTRHSNVLCNLHPMHAIYAQTSQCFKTITQACQSYYHCPPVNGGWSSYTYADCSVTCGGGTRTGTRSCTNPSPQYGGTGCTGSSTVTGDCNTQTCPVDGGWSEYGAPTSCSTTCGPGSSTETRTCDNPAPTNGGTCPGSETNTVYCNADCPVNGVWSEWSVSVACTATCGTTGVRTYERACDNPAESNGGTTCSIVLEGVTKTESCNTDPCPVDGVLSGWANSGSCCGTGTTQLQIRTCDDQVGAGADCVGVLSQMIACSSGIVCDVNGEWSEFPAAGACSNACGEGVQTQTRTCTNPTPAGSGATCPGSNVHTVACTGTTC